MNAEQSQFSLWQDVGFSVESTLDGSPTLRIKTPKDSLEVRPESMHHSGGAFSESVYIYGQILDEAMKKLRLQDGGIQVLSLGLGLGYNELLAAAYALKHGHAETFHLQSFEIVSSLKTWFLSFCQEKSLPENIHNTYAQMMSFYEKHFEIPQKQIRSCLSQAYETRRWLMQENFAQTEKKKSHVILYDAFSGKTNQELWTEEFLVSSLREASSENVLFATYACRASLKNALRDCDYQVVVRDGFLGKRNSTQGRRGLFKSEDFQIYSHTR